MKAEPEIAAVRSRAASLSHLQDARPQVLVIGGGINGASVYRELALNGVNVMLVERSDFCAGASSALSRMVHGGLRYLENGEFDLVREALDERNRLLRNAPHLVTPLRTLVPLDSWISGTLNAPLKFLGLRDAPSRRGAIPVKLGLSFYDIYTRGRGGLPKHRILSRRAVRKRLAGLADRVRCAATYYDAQVVHPERIVTEILEDVARSGASATALNYLEVVEIDAAGVRMRDRLDGGEFRIVPQLVINATGAWIDRTNARREPPAAEPMVQGTKGSHLILDHPELRQRLGSDMVYYENSDGRICIMFVLHDKVLIGSTDLKVPDPDAARCEQDESSYILDGLSYVFPDIEVASEQVIYRFAGVRPLPVSGAGTTGQIPRGHFIRWFGEKDVGRAPPMLCMIGGKWTTFRAFGELAADEVFKFLGQARHRSTTELPIGGGAGWPSDVPAWIACVAEESSLSTTRVGQLLSRYGTLARALASAFRNEIPLPGVPGYSEQEIDYLITHEQVESIEDLVLRRMTIALSGGLTRAALRALATRLARHKRWSDEECDSHLAETERRLSELHGVQLERCNTTGAVREVAAQ